MLEDVARDVGFVDARVLVRLEVLQGILRDALMLRKICHLSVAILRLRGGAGKGVRTFAGRHPGAGGRRRERHECCGDGGLYRCVRDLKPCRCGGYCSETDSCGGIVQPSRPSSFYGTCRFDRNAGINCGAARHWRSTSRSST
jgi:hypothetical protein